MKDLRRVYQAPTKAVAEEELVQLEKKWGQRYPIVIRSWKSKWEHLSTYFEYSPEIRKLIYTTNPVEALHRGFRKVTKAKSVFPTDAALEKMLYMAYLDISSRRDPSEKNGKKPSGTGQKLLPNWLSISKED